MKEKKYKLVKEKKEVDLVNCKEFIKKVFRTKSGIKLLTCIGVIVLCGAIFISAIKSPIIISQNREETTSYSVVEVVDAGETLSQIALRYNTTVEKIVSDNNIDNPNKIQVGQNLIISVEVKTMKIKVKKGDTLERIAYEYNTTVEKIKQLNPTIGENEIKKNQILIVPFMTQKQLDLDAWDKKIEENGYVQGIDLSYAQENIDLNRILNLEENKSIDFVFARSFYFWGGREVDRTFDKFCKIAVDNGKALGTYFWPTLIDIQSTKEELDILISKLRENESRGIYYTMPICMDIELTKDGGCGLAERIQRGDQKTIEAFEFAVNYLRQNGYKVMVYTSATCARECNIRQLADKNNVELWLAGGVYYKSGVSLNGDTDRYLTPLTNLEGVGTGRQYCEGTIAGYDGPVDLNVWYRNTPREIIKSDCNNTDKMPKTKIKR